MLLFLAYRINQVMDHPDFLVYWLAGDLLISGESPYNQVLWSQRAVEIEWLFDQTFLYPIPTAMFFTLWARIPYRFSYLLWMFFCMVLIIASLLLVISRWKDQSKAVRYLLPAIAGLVIFRPVLVSIRNGQIGGLLLFILVAAMVLWQDRKWLYGGVVFSFLLFKPNIAVPLYALFGLYFILTWRWKAIIGISAGSLVLIGLGFFVSPSWVREFIEISRRKFDQTFGYAPTLWGASHQICLENSYCTIPVAGLLSLLLVGLFIWIVIKQKPSVMDAGAAIAPLALLLFPYGWAYEQTLLVISIPWIMGLLSEKRSFLLSSTVFILFSMLSVSLIFLAVSLTHDAYSFIVPLICFLGLIVLIPSRLSLKYRDRM
jgi:hypothetical protein